MRTFGQGYFGPGSPTFDYSTTVDDMASAYVDPSVPSRTPTYPGAGTMSDLDTSPRIEITGANWVGSLPSEWALPDFHKPASLLPLGLLLAAGAGVVWWMSKPASRRRRSRA